jgi:hypothetical protein
MTFTYLWSLHRIFVVCEVSGFHGAYKDDSLLGYSTAFQKANILFLLD